MEASDASPALNGTSGSPHDASSPSMKTEAATGLPAETAPATDAAALQRPQAAAPSADTDPDGGSQPVADAAAEQADDGGIGRPGQHLLKHAVSPEVRAAAVAEFGDDALAAGTAICRLRQPLLRATFTKVFGVETTSGNNDWMRGKLLQAVGLGNRWRPPADASEAADAQRKQDEGGSRTMRQRNLPARLQYSNDEDESEEEDEEARVVARRRKRGRGVTAGAADKRGRPAPTPPPPAGSLQRLHGQQLGLQQQQQGQQGQQQGPQQQGQVPPQGPQQQEQPTVVVMLPGGQVAAWPAEQLAWQQQAQQQAAQLQGLQQLQQQAQQQLHQQLQQEVQRAQLLQQRQPFGLAGAAGFGGNAPSEVHQLLALQQMSQSNGGGAVEQAALTALHALGLLPPSGGGSGGLPPAMLAPRPAVNPLMQHGQPILLQPGQVNSAWPVVLAPGFEGQQASAAAATLAAAQQRQLQQQDGQLWQQRLEQAQQQARHQAQQVQQAQQAQQQAQQAATARLAGVAGSAGSQPGSGAAIAAAAVKSVAAAPSTAPSPFAEQAAVPLSSSWTAHLQQQQQREPSAGEPQPLSAPPRPAAQQQQHQAGQAPPLAPPGGGTSAALFASAALREGSLMADLKALEAMGWSASLASLPTLSADLHALFQAWQEGRVSMSLAPDLKPAP